MKSFQLTLFAALASMVSGGKAAAATAPEGNAIVDYVMGLVNDLISAFMGTAKDGADLLMGVPRFYVDVTIYLLDMLRGLPDRVVNIYNGDAAEQKKMNDFCVYAAGVIFSVYASITALNLVLSTFAAVKDYFSKYLVIPVKVLGSPLPDPIMKVRNMIQKQCLDRIINFTVAAWIIPLEGHTGKPSIKAAASQMATVTSACMILSSVPAAHGLMSGGADKAAAEALAWTLGTALGVQYLVKLNA